MYKDACSSFLSQNPLRIIFLCVWASLVMNVLSDEVDGGKAPRIPLKDGHSIPVLGLGTFLGFDEKGQKEVKEHEVEDQVSVALNAGYRLVDSAQAYKNEEQVGLGVRKSNVPREHVFIVTKLAPNRQREVVPALRDSLRLLNMSYVDLYLIHNPVAFTADETEFDNVDYLDTWKGMEEAKKLGLAKSIGISNFNISQIERVLANCEIEPAVLQVEVNLNLAQTRLTEFCKEHNIVVMAYTPFGSLFSKEDSSPAPKVEDLAHIAKEYKKTAPQIALKYLVQRGLVPIPKSTRKEKIEENIDIFDFNLTANDMEYLGNFSKEPYYPDPCATLHRRHRRRIALCADILRSRAKSGLANPTAVPHY